MTEQKFEVVDDYTVKYDGDYFDLHKPSDIRSFVTVVNYIVIEIQKLKKENKLLEIEDENWTKLSEEDENTINELNAIMQKINKLFDEKIREYQFKPQLTCYIPTTCEHKDSCLHNHEINVINGAKLQLLKELRKEIYQE